MRIAILMSMLFLSGCGYSARNNELTGQVKRVVSQTPIFCEDRTDVDLSLGVMRNGVGSMSNQDVLLTVPNQEDVLLLKQAAATGALVTITYDVKRITWCWEDHIVTHVQLVQ